MLEGLADERASRSTEWPSWLFLASGPGAGAPTRIVQLAGAPEGGFPFPIAFVLEQAVELEKPELFEGPEWGLVPLAPFPCGPELSDDVDDVRERVETETGVPLATVALLLDTEKVPFANLPLACLVGGDGLSSSRGRKAVPEGGRVLALLSEDFERESPGKSGRGRPALGLVRSMVLLCREREPERGLKFAVPLGTDCSLPRTPER